MVGIWQENASADLIHHHRTKAKIQRTFEVSVRRGKWGLNTKSLSVTLRASQLTGAEGLYPGETPSRVPVKSNSSRSEIVWNIELGTVRDLVKRNGEDLESIQRCITNEERTQRMGGKWQGWVISLQGSGWVGTRVVQSSHSDLEEQQKWFTLINPGVFFWVNSFE